MTSIAQALLKQLGAEQSPNTRGRDSHSQKSERDTGALNPYLPPETSLRAPAREADFDAYCAWLDQTQALVRQMATDAARAYHLRRLLELAT